MGDDDGGHGRKRNYDGGDSSSPQKKSFMNDPDAVYLKFMVPQATAGSVIGKGGQNISDLQKEFGVHIRMSKANDVFPGSDSRVALMSGKVNNVLNATMVIFKRMTSPSDLFPKNPRPKSVSDKELSLIVPQSTAGLIIGKGGSRVKSIQEEANCHINLTQKTEQLPSNERVVTIQNNDTSPDNIEKALKLILEVIKTDPQSGSCLMINYTNPEGDRPSGHHPGHHHNSRRDDYNDDYYDEPPHRGGGGGGGRNWDRGNNNGAGNMGGMGMGGGGGRGDAMSTGPATNAGGFPTASGYPPQVHFWCTFSGPPIANGHTPPPHMIEGMKSYLLNVGYPPKAIQEIIAASNILASYGILKPGNISIFNTPQIQAANPFNTMSGNGSESLGMSGLGSMGGGVGGNMNSMGGGMDGGWSNSMGGGGAGGGGGGGGTQAGMFMNKFQQGGASNNRGGGLDGGFGFDSGYMSGMGGGGGMNSNLGGYGKNDASINDVKRRF